MLCSVTQVHCFSAALQGTPLSATLSLLMSQCCRKIKDTVQKLASDHKDIHSSVSRVGKAIDRVSGPARVATPGSWQEPGWEMSSVSLEPQGPAPASWQNFDSEICGVVSDSVWDSREKQQQSLQTAIVEHLYQQGMLSVAEELCQVRVVQRACPFFLLEREASPALRQEVVLKTTHAGKATLISS